VCALVFPLAGCDSEPPDLSLPLLQDSAGVTIWSGGRETTDAMLVAERVGALSLPDSGWVVEADGVAVDGDGGRIYVLDELGSRLLAFSVQGDLIGQVGRPGEGPGEYEMPVAVDVDADGVVRVVDGSRSLLLSWDRQGRHLGQTRLSPTYWGPGFKVSGGAFLYVRGDEDGDGESFTETLIRSGDGPASELLSLAQRWAAVNSPCGNLSLPEAMAPSTTWGANAGSVVAAVWPDYTLPVFEGDALVGSPRRAVPPLRVTQVEAEEAVANGPHDFLIESCGMSPAEVLRATGSAERVSPIDRITVDPLGRIWARRTRLEGDTHPIDILDRRNGYLGSLDAPVFPVAFLSGERFLATVERDGGSAVEIWKVAESASRAAR
jgi:hypothetical protein